MDHFEREVADAITTDIVRADFLGHCPAAAPQNWCEYAPCRDLPLGTPPASQLPRLPSFQPPHGKGTTPAYVEGKRRERRTAYAPANATFRCEAGDGEHLGSWKVGALSTPPHFSEEGCVLLCRAKYPGREVTCHESTGSGGEADRKAPRRLYRIRRNRLHATGRRAHAYLEH